MARQTSKGKCSFCNDIFGKGSIKRHLQSCEKRKIPDKVSGGKKPQLGMSFHILVDAGPYWMHLEVPVNAKLKILDAFLRDIWLECCGHLSVFKIDGVNYSSYPDEEFDDETMDIRLGKVLVPEMKFHHEYDFGSTTVLKLKVLSEQKSETGGTSSIKVLARNEAPFIPCSSCGKNATQFCMECLYEEEGCFCDKCVSEHECDEDMFLPVINSPRTGVCGYVG